MDWTICPRRIQEIPWLSRKFLMTSASTGPITLVSFRSFRPLSAFGLVSSSMGSPFPQIVLEDLFVVKGQRTRPVIDREDSDLLGIVLGPGPAFCPGDINRGDRVEAWGAGRV